MDSEHAVINLLSLLFFVVLLVIPPTVYHYCLSLTNDYKKEGIHKMYYLPLALLVINLLSYAYLNLQKDESSYIFTVCQSVMEIANAVALLFIFPLQNVYYLFKAFKFYKDHRKKVRDEYSYEEGVSLKWMLHFILGYLIFILLIYVLYSATITSIYIPITTFITVYLIYIGIKGNKQEVVLLELESINSNIIENTVLINDEKTTLLKKKLLDYMIVEQPYLDSKLTIHQLAKQLDTNSKYLSKVLNTEFQKNFVSFINQYRIETAKEFLIDKEYQLFTIEAIAEKSGFNSKSAFNTAFKKTTQKTPSQFKKDYTSS